MLLDMTSRYLGLVVVPGEYVSRIEVEEFESQVRGRKAVLGKDAPEVLAKGRREGIV